MPVLRLCAGSVSMRRSPKRIAPASSSANPAPMRSKAVSPQADGPRSVKNSPSRMASETSRTACTDPKDRLTPSIAMLAKAGPRPALASARLLDQLLQLLEGGGARLGPRILGIGQELEARERRHVAGQLREIEVLPGRAAEGGAQDHLAHVLAVDVVDEPL